MNRLLRLINLFIIFVRTVSVVQEAADGSVCFNNCNGHGDCIDYSCNCWAGFHGDDCGITYATDENDIVPILTAGNISIAY